MSGVVKDVEPLRFPFQTPDPFLFAVYHNDAYPAGETRERQREYRRCFQCSYRRGE